MIQWTDSARAKLEEYFARVRPTLSASGADADEVIEDLRRHLNEEATAFKLTVLTEEDVQRLLSRIGAPKPADAPLPAEPAASPSTTGTAHPEPRRPGWTLLFVGVVLPVITLGFEFLTGACAGVFFDPLPNVGNVLLVALVPLANLLVWLAVRSARIEHHAKLGLANGCTVGVALVYALFFVPLTPFAALGVLFFGFGLIPLTPLLSLIAALLLRRHLRRAGGAESRLPGLWAGAAAGVFALALCSLPMILTETGMQMAASDEPAEKDRGVRLLRTFGQEERMLRFCYGRAGRAAGLYSFGNPVHPEAARAIYYRVTGRAFNAVPPPRLYAGRARWSVLEQEFTWDDDQGGDAVAGRVKGLSLVSSRQDGFVDADAALGYLEWTLEFKNDSVLQREARAQIALPPGGVLSRLTLWIDGEEREAAFGGRSQVKTAYKEVVKQRRDPVLVTTCGPDRVLMQCFPVPANGGRMKVRVGITAPLVLANGDEGVLRWPCFLERNFTLREQLRHSLWLESEHPLETSRGKLVSENTKAGRHAVRGQVSDSELGANRAVVRARRVGNVSRAWTADTRGGDGYIIRQTLVERAMSPPDRVVVVVDGARGMEAFFPVLAEALSGLSNRVEFSVLLASDGCKELAGPAAKGDSAVMRVAEALREVRCIGGHDNIPALARACDLAAQGTNGVVLWIHGPQPVLLESAEELRQRFERRPEHLVLLEIQTQAGPNRVAEQLDGIDAVRSVSRLGDLREDLGRVFAEFSSGAKRIELVRERTQSSQPPFASEGKETSLHLARLWAVEEVQRLRAARKLAEATQLATLYQLLTPVSGAVVLETQQQYARAGLQPVDAATVPVIPEPSTWVLLGLALLLGGPVIVRRRTFRS